MFNKKALRKDTFREIKRSFSRFISIFGIIALGSGFFAGLKATCPDMKESAKQYFNENNFMDVKLVSSIGISDDDVKMISEIDGVKDVMPSYSKDLCLNINSDTAVVKAMSYKLNDKNILNKPVVTEGRLPEKSGECLVERNVIYSGEYVIGKTLTVTSGDDKDVSQYLKKDTYKIVGVATTPLYVGYERGKTNIGNGDLTGYIIIPEEDFISERPYTEIYATIDKANKLDPFSDAYYNKIDEYVPKLENALFKSVDKRSKDYLTVMNAELDNLEKDVDLTKKLLTDNVWKLKNEVDILQQKAIELKNQFEKIDEENSEKFVLGTQLLQIEEFLEKAQMIILNSDEKPTKKDINKQIKEKEQMVLSKNMEIEMIKNISVYSFDRTMDESYTSFSSDSKRIDLISGVFPIFFIIVAMLVCLTTMTRMVEENRIEIGTLTALGYSKFSIAYKFLFYSITATILGCFTGLAIGFKVLPYIIYEAYKMMYTMPSIQTPFKWDYAIIITISAIILVIITVLIACGNELRSVPSKIMRPKAPPKGKRVLIEKIPFIWNKFNFLTKVTVRNLFRYKKRFFMTVIGIAGCTALVLTGFGVKDSISSIVQRQFDSVFIFDASAAYSQNYDDKKIEKLFDDEKIAVNMPSYQTTVNISYKNQKREMNLFIPKDVDLIDKFVSLQTRKEKKKIILNDDGIIINEKLAILLGVKIGDTVDINNSKHDTKKVKIAAINENYTMNYSYMTNNLYKELYGKFPVYNSQLFNFKEDVKEYRDQFSRKIISSGQIVGIKYTEDSRDAFKDLTKALNSVVLVLILCAGALAFIVLYNLSNINITERLRELATIKLLGFYDNEVRAYISRENSVCSIIGIIIGLFAGVFLHRFVISTAEIDIMMFSREISLLSFVFSGIITLVFSLIVNLILHFKLENIDMIESLKSVE